MTKVISGDPCFGGYVSTVAYEMPCPAIEGFGYSSGMGVLRTTVATGHARQRRLHLEEPRTYNLTWQLTTTQLRDFEAFASNHGYAWHFMPMVTGQVYGWFPVEHPLRFISDYSVELLREDLWGVSVQAEQYVLDPDCMFELICDELLDCLPHYFPLTNADFSGFAAAVGADTTWGSPNG